MIFLWIVITAVLCCFAPGVVLPVILGALSILLGIPTLMGIAAVLAILGGMWFWLILGVILSRGSAGT